MIEHTIWDTSIEEKNCTALTFDLENLTLKVKFRLGPWVSLNNHGMVLHLHPLAKNQHQMPSALLLRVLAGWLYYETRDMLCSYLTEWYASDTNATIVDLIRVLKKEERNLI